LAGRDLQPAPSDTQGLTLSLSRHLTDELLGKNLLFEEH